MASESSSMKKALGFWVGPAIFILCRFALEATFGVAGACAVGVSLWMIAWWVTGAVSLAVTAIIPVVINGLFNFVPMGSVISQYSSETIVLLFGACLLTMPWTTTGLDRRLALFALRLVGNNVKHQMIVWFVVSALFSSVLANTVVVTLLTPVAVAMLKFLGHNDLKKSDLTGPILLAVAYGSIVGGGITPLGGAMNVIAIDLVEAYTGQEFMYIDWILHMTPIALLVGIAIVIGMLVTPLKTKTLEGTKEYFANEYASLGKMKRGEAIAATLFAVGVILSFTRPLYASILPALSPAYVLLGLGILGFMISDEKKKPILTWEYAQQNMMWTMLFLVASGSLMGYLITASGAADTIAVLITGMSLTGGLGMIFIFSIFTYLIAEGSTQTAAASIAIPVVLSVTTALGINPTPYVFITCMAFTGSYLLPVGVRSISVGYGLNVNECIKRGSGILIINAIAVPLIGFILMSVWPYFSQLPGLTP